MAKREVTIGLLVRCYNRTYMYDLNRRGVMKLFIPMIFITIFFITGTSFASSDSAGQDYFNSVKKDIPCYRGNAFAECSGDELKKLIAYTEALQTKIANLCNKPDLKDFSDKLQSENNSWKSYLKANCDLQASIMSHIPTINFIVGPSQASSFGYEQCVGMMYIQKVSETIHTFPMINELCTTGKINIER